MITVLIGEEPLLVRRELERLLDQRLPRASRDFNRDIFEAAELDVGRLLEAAGTLPFLTPRRVVLIRNVQELKKSAMESLEPALDNLPGTTDLILTGTKIDGRLGFWKRIASIGAVRELKPPDDREIPAWIAGEVRERGGRIEPEAVAGLTAAIGRNLSALHNTLEKLLLLKREGETIGPDDVEAVTTGISWKTVFELGDAVGKRDLSRALVLAEKMIASGESPVGLVAILARHFRILSKIREGGTAGLSPFLADRYREQAVRFTPSVLASRREMIFHADWALKSSRIPPKIRFERLLIDLCR